MQWLTEFACMAAAWLGQNFSTVIDTIAALIAAGALVFAAYQIKLAAQMYRASTVSHVTARSEELQWRILENEDLRPLLMGTTGLTPQVQQEMVAGMVINHFATMYDLYSLGGISTNAWEAFKADMKVTLSLPVFRRRWSKLKQFHAAEFRTFIAEELGVKDEKEKPRKEGRKS
ncbi:hypothetical protein [Chelativorans salis]|uniref:Uncharacterized protein n=1 Tax=Chelativorans salis TaxID=2978478 RepID=A0ABT2LMU8_9HYPH|nr:hypothetical protein [Chelativorans sp. EGI FJ00035]MCT7375895.1 hypothetical protein [Chelativorans sp. EGI FJ00035]